MALWFRFGKKLLQQRLNISYVSQKCFHQSNSVFNASEYDVNKKLFKRVGKEAANCLRRVTVIGAGSVGITTAWFLLVRNICDEIVLYEHESRKAHVTGEALDLSQLQAMGRFPRVLIAFSAEETAGSDVIIVTCGVRSTKGQSRLALAQDNVNIMKQIIPPIAELSPDAVFLGSSNPVDLITYAIWKYSDFEKNRCLGVSCDLDTNRFKYFIGKRLGISPKSVNSWVIGEHGNSSVPAWSGVSVAGTKFREIDAKIATDKDPFDWNDTHKQVVESGPLLIKMKDYTNWGIGWVSSEIVLDILTDKRNTHSVSVCAKGLYGITTECFLSLPAIIGNRGVHSIIKIKLNKDEIKKLVASAETLQAVTDTIKF